MIAIEQMTDEDFERHAFAILQKELGLKGLVRFLRLNRGGVGLYNRDRNNWLDGAGIDQIIAGVEPRTKP
jgi:hypothetical protein